MAALFRADAAAFYFKVAQVGESGPGDELELVESSTGRLAKLVPLEFGPDGVAEVFFELGGIKPGHWEARLTQADDLAADDVVYLGLNARPPVSVGIVAAENWFFRNCVAAFERAGGFLRAARDLANADMLLAEGSIESGERADF